MYEIHIEVNDELPRQLQPQPNLLDACDVLIAYLHARQWVVSNNLGTLAMQSWDVADNYGRYVGTARILDNERVTPPDVEGNVTPVPTPLTDEASIRRLSAEQYDTLSEASNRLDELGYGILGEAVTAIAEEYGPYS